MTREEAIFCEKSYMGETNCIDCKYYGTDTCKSRETHKMAIKALEQPIVAENTTSELVGNSEQLGTSKKTLAIPDNATNGDMIKAMFPNAEFYNSMPFTDGRWETMNLDTENKTRAIYEPTQLRTYADWWNAPYKS